jgi:hypothetical protein
MFSLIQGRFCGTFAFAGLLFLLAGGLVTRLAVIVSLARVGHAELK